MKTEKSYSWRSFFNLTNVDTLKVKLHWISQNHRYHINDYSSKLSKFTLMFIVPMVRPWNAGSICLLCTTAAVTIIWDSKSLNISPTLILCNSAIVELLCCKNGLREYSLVSWGEGYASGEVDGKAGIFVTKTVLRFWPIACHIAIFSPMSVFWCTANG